MSHAKNYSNWPMFHRVIEKNNSGMFLWTKVHCFSIASCKNKEYLTAVFKH